MTQQNPQDQQPQGLPQPPPTSTIPNSLGSHSPNPSQQSPPPSPLSSSQSSAQSGSPQSPTSSWTDPTLSKKSTHSFPISGFTRDPENDKRNTPPEAPWKYVGYRIFSRWMASDSAFLMVRRFGALNARIMLSMQDQIVQLEQELDDIEETLCGVDLDKDIQNGTFHHDKFKERRKLVEETIPEKLTKYNDFVNSYIQLVNRAPIHKDDLESVKKWMRINDKAIDLEEARFIHQDDDLIGIQPKARSWFRNILESTFLLRTPGIRTFFERKPRDADLIRDATKSNKKQHTIWPNDKRVEGLSSTVIALMGLGMLVGPLWILAFVDATVQRLEIITGFIVLFFVLVAVATNAKIFDALAAAAAYSAVLMVFLQVATI